MINYIIYLFILKNHFLKTEGYDDFKFLMLVATEVDGLVFGFYPIKNGGFGSGSVSNLFLRKISFGGFGKYSGNAAREHE
jgi:hypothetical protein